MRPAACTGETARPRLSWNVAPPHRPERTTEQPSSWTHPNTEQSMGVHARKYCSRLEVQPLFHRVRLFRGLSSYVFAEIASKRPAFAAIPGCVGASQDQ